MVCYLLKAYKAVFIMILKKEIIMFIPFYEKYIAPIGLLLIIVFTLMNIFLSKEELDSRP